MNFHHTAIYKENRVLILNWFVDNNNIIKCLGNLLFVLGKILKKSRHQIQPQHRFKEALSEF